MADHVGQQLGNYRLTRLLGRGGFADVYLGEHVYLETQAAIKVLHTQLSLEDQESFLLEARTIARLTHPHIVPVLECGIVMSIPFLAMDYASNGNLRQRYRKGVRLTPVLILPYVKHLAAALQHAHDEGIIHRDIKPENMLLGPENGVLLSDFGIALGTQSSRSQNMREVAGTAEYMAPEQLQGKPCPASDQYGLAIVIYEWLSGDTPFRGSFAEIASQHVLIPPPSLKKIPAVSAAVENVVMTALAKDPKQRFTSMQAFSSAFEEASLLEEETAKSQLSWFAMLGAPEDKTARAQPGWFAQVGAPEEETVRAQQEKLSFPDTPNFGQDSQATQVTSDRTIPPSSAASMLAEAQPAQKGGGMEGRLIERRSNGRTQGHVPTAYTSTPPLQRRRSPSREMVYLFTTLALLVIFSGLGLAFYTAGLYRTSTPVQGTPAAITSPTAQMLQNVYVRATSGRPVLNDPLSMNDANNWSVNASNIGSCAFLQGALHAIASHTYTLQPCIAQSGDFSNFAFQVQMTISKGDAGGLIFRANATNSDTPWRFDFGIDQSGSFGLLVISQGNSNILIQRPSSAIKAGVEQPNLLTVVAQGSNIYLYVNRQYAGSVSDGSIIAGKIGVFARENIDPTDVAFSNAQVWKL
jgi:serine/threonine protein kinase